MIDVIKKNILSLLKKKLAVEDEEIHYLQKMITGVSVTDKKLFIALTITDEIKNLADRFDKKIKKAAQILYPDKQIFATFTAEKQSPILKKKKQLSCPQDIPGIKKIIAVASGKGGVGKSTTAFNVAVAFAKQGLKVGILDADIYGPSLPCLSGLKETPCLDEHHRLIPTVSHGIKLMSVGFLINNESPVIWRGPMVSGMVQKMLEGVVWSPLDILIIDLPPGTGDIQITLVQKIKLSGVLIVSTPQDLAAIDAEKAIAMFQRIKIPIIGVVENMSYFVAPDTKKIYHLFGKSVLKTLCQKLKVPFLEKIPFYLQIREASDQGKPLGVFHPEDESVKAYQELAFKINLN